MMFSKFSITDGKNHLEGIMAVHCAFERIFNFIDKSENKDSISLTWYELDDYGEEDDSIVTIYSVAELADLDEDQRVQADYSEYEKYFLDVLAQ